MQPLEEQLKAAPQHLVLAPELLPHLTQQAERLLCHATYNAVSDLACLLLTEMLGQI